MKELTQKMREALELAHKNGGMVCAGDDVQNGRVVRVNARTLDGLVDRGLATHCFSGDGGMAVRLVRSQEVADLLF